MSPEWIYDDVSIPNDVTLYRRITNQPNVFVTDAVTGDKTLGLAVFSYKDDDGMSVYLSNLMDVEEIVDDDLIDWETDKLSRFSLAVVRRSKAGEQFAGGKPLPSGTVPAGEMEETAGGVIPSPGTGSDDERVNRSHGLVRLPVSSTSSDAKRLWGPFRVKLMEAAEFKEVLGGPWTAA